MTITVPNPSLTTYKSLQIAYTNTLRCPCSNKTIPHQLFLSISFRFHQICSSGFVDDGWLKILHPRGVDSMKKNWRNHAFVQFQMLSEFCRIANETINDAINRYLSQAFIASSVMNEIDFKQQIDAVFTQLYQSLIFALNQIHEIDSTATKCVCAINPNCQSTAAIYYESDDLNLIYSIPGWSQGCSGMDSLRMSTLQCLYPSSDPDCFRIILSFLTKIPDSVSFVESSSFDFQPLVYDPTVSRFPPNTSMSIILKEMMLEQWNVSSSYQNFYELCAPTYCSYSQRVRKQTFLGVVITLVSMIGGIVVSLRLVTPYVVKFILSLLTMSKRKPKRREQVELNIFKLRDFGTHVDRVTAKRYGRWATRLHIVLYLGSIAILIFYTAIQPHTLTKIFDQPSPISYNHLREKYGDELKCTCSNVASTYNRFVEIKPVFHSICLREFVSEEWRLGFISGLDSNLSVYQQTDYRQFLSAHLQFLQGLCRFSIQSVNNSINEFLTSLLVTNEILSNNTFHDHLNLLIEKKKSNAPVLFSRLLFLTRSINHGNAFISTYGTNFEYIFGPEGKPSAYTATKAIIYDNDCSCGLFSNCTTQATFIETNSSAKVSIKGLKMGCTPSESLLVSTLECFYDQSCLDHIQKYTNYKDSLNPLSTTNSSFLQNITIDELIHNLFLESWSTSMDYSLYYEQCSPAVCSYTTTERFNILYTITIILGLQGGLTIVLKWICPKFVRIGSKIYHYRKTKAKSVHPVGSISSSPTLNCETQIVYTTSQNNIVSSIRPRLKIILITVLLSYFYLELNSHQFPECSTLRKSLLRTIYSTTNSQQSVNLNTTINTTMTTSSTTEEPICQSQFEHIISNSQCSKLSNIPSIVTDVNNDNKMDIIFHCYLTETLNILLGNGNGTFHEMLTVSVRCFNGINSFRIGDMNNDAQIDLIIVCQQCSNFSEWKFPEFLE
ncbi:hypothetical protein I4U23_011455, partial [Adineta vaga]